MNTQDLVKCITEAVENIKGRDIVVIDVSATSTVTDTMIICTGTSTRHTCAIANNVCEALHKANVSTHGIEGEASGDWVLLDAGNAILHVLIADTREMYQLEKLYSAV